MNKKLLQTLCALASVVFFSVNALAEESYFSADKISPTLLDKPLSRTSADYENEVLAIIEMQKKAQSIDLERSNKEDNLRAEGVAYIADDKLKRSDYPQLYKMLDRAFYTTFLVTENCKNYWNTKRPFASEKRIKPLIAISNNPSYPSGHTSSSYVLARILSQLIPEKSADFMSRAQEIAYHRILTGMHYPHDIEGGKQLSLIVIGSLMQNKEFIADFKRAKAEIKSK